MGSINFQDTKPRENVRKSAGVKGADSLNDALGGENRAPIGVNKLTGSIRTQRCFSFAPRRPRGRARVNALGAILSAGRSAESPPDSSSFADESRASENGPVLCRNCWRRNLTSRRKKPAATPCDVPFSAGPRCALSFGTAEGHLWHERVSDGYATDKY